MNSIRFGILALLVAVCGVSQTSSAQTSSAETKGPASDKERLIGVWHLASIAEPDGKPVTTGVPIGMLIYTRDGHMSVQLMYPKSASALSNEYVQNGYEASFGGYDIKRGYSHADSSRAAVEYWGTPCRQGSAARLPVRHRRATGYQVGPAGRTLVSQMGALPTASCDR
jgi:hypothetical protein